MKNLLIGLLLVGLTTQGFSQQKKSPVEQVKLQDVLITNTLPDVPIININYSYLDKVQNKTTAKRVKTLESIASKFNVKDMPEFDARNAPFETIFRGTKGYIIATYDSEGKIMSTVERYRDLKIPKKMVKYVLSQFPESTFLRVVHNVNYNSKKDVKKTYRIRIMNDNSKKNLKITSRGDSENSYAMTIE